MKLAGKYQLQKVLGEGAFGQVWKARDHGALERDVAIKLIKKEESDDDLRKRLQREAKIASDLSHPRIVRVFDADWDQGHLFIVMELLKGRDLKAVMAQRQGV